MNRQLLDQPFVANEIKQRVGGNGKTLDYVEGHTVIARLNEVFDAMWNFEIADYGIDEANDEVRVLGKLTAENVVKMQFGSSSITRNKTTKEPVSIGDDLKAAATDALKKCATLLGVGLHLHAAKTQNAVPTESRPHPSPTPNPPIQTSSKGLSTRQLGYLLTLGRENGMTPSKVDAMAEERFGTVLSYLTKAQASALIAELSRPKGMGQGQPPAEHSQRDAQ